MSLLLDALKKAAEDKKKASNNISDSTAVPDEVQVAPEVTDDLTLEDIDAEEVGAQENESSVTSSGIEFEKTNHKEEKISDEELTLDVESVAAVEENSRPIVNETRHSVSDEALSLLIYKTNAEEKKRKRIFAIGTTMASLLVLGLGAAYYYFNLEEEINSLESKHRTAMMRTESKTNKQRPPEKAEIISNLTANNDIEIDKKEIIVAAVEKAPQVYKQASSVKRNQVVESRAVENKARLLLIEKTKQADVIGKKLDTAWVAYEAANYSEAKNLYQEVILVEKNNRDALLGLGAIAVLEKDTAKAKVVYRNLLKLDPNDPLAIAALTNLRSEESSPKLSEKYLIAMLEKTPEVAQLNFELGNIYAKQNKWSAAQESYFKAWQQEGENADYLFNLAVSLDQLGQQQQAMSFYKDSLVKAKNKQVGFSRKTVEKRVTELSGL
jgi:Flp pilus assembly protein TadD